VPTYEYACTDCGNRLEVVQRFTDTALTECPACQGRLRKVFYPVGVVFKGSGFYRTDSRAPAKEPVPAGSANGKPAGTSDSAGQTADKVPAASGNGAKPKKPANTPAG
jgi:putative FmdB family regulatory protein